MARKVPYPVICPWDEIISRRSSPLGQHGRLTLDLGLFHVLVLGLFQMVALGILAHVRG